MTDASITCPICGVVIPLPLSDAPNSLGLSVGLDDTYAVEHADMHVNCLCTWSWGTINKVNPDCPRHGLLPDLLTV